MKNLIFTTLLLTSISSLGEFQNLPKLKCESKETTEMSRRCGTRDGVDHIKLEIGELKRSTDILVRDRREVDIDVKLTSRCYFVEQRINVKGEADVNVANFNDSDTIISSVNNPKVQTEGLTPAMSGAVLKFPEGIEEDTFPAEIHIITNHVSSDGEDIELGTRKYDVTCQR